MSHPSTEGGNAGRVFCPHEYKSAVLRCPTALRTNRTSGVACGQLHVLTAKCTELTSWSAVAGTPARPSASLELGLCRGLGCQQAGVRVGESFTCSLEVREGWGLFNSPIKTARAGGGGILKERQVPSPKVGGGMLILRQDCSCEN